MKLLSGITHAIITSASTKAAANKNGVYAKVDLCFGPSDNNCLTVLYIKNSEHGQMGWRLGTLKISDRAAIPVFKGKLPEEVSEFAARALDRLKKDLGKFEFGKRYRVTQRGAVLEPIPEVKEK